MTIPYLTTMVLTPLNGFFTDKYGYRIHIHTFGNFILLSFAVYFYFLPNNTADLVYAVVPLLSFGVFNGILESIIWPIFPLLVKEENVGLGFGCVSVINNIFLALIPLLNGWLHDIRSEKGPDGKWAREDYSLVMVSMGVQTIIGATLLLYLYKIDGGKKGMLSKKQKFM